MDIQKIMERLLTNQDEADACQKMVEAREDAHLERMLILLEGLRSCRKWMTACQAA
jgi:hypothetical protein